MSTTITEITRSDMANSPKLLDQVRELLRIKHYALKTEEAYVYWIRRFILFHNKRHPRDMGASQIHTFLAHLAVKENVAASTQTQALSALLFLYREVLHQELEAIELQSIRAKKPKRLPVVLTRNEVKQVLSYMTGRHLLMARLLYGSGLRLMECLRLRVKDIDFERQQITVREGKGDKDRVTMLPTPSYDLRSEGAFSASADASQPGFDPWLWLCRVTQCACT
jgi:integrase